MRRLLRKAFAFAEGLLYPHAVNCLCCTESRQVSEYDSLCNACREKLKGCRVPAEACNRCLMPVERGKPCAFCASTVMRDILRVYAPFRYAGEARAIIHNYKFNYNDDALPILTDSMANALTDRDFDCIVPVPMHRYRLMERGSNHTEVLAQALSKKVGLPVYMPLQRTSYHRPQSRTAHKNREHNVKNAFCCKGDVNGLKVLLLDDVRTTGSTAAECAKALMQNGAMSVSLWVWAIVYRQINKTNKKTVSKRFSASGKQHEFSR